MKPESAILRMDGYHRCVFSIARPKHLIIRPVLFHRLSLVFRSSLIFIWGHSSHSGKSAWLSVLVPNPKDFHPFNVAAAYHALDVRGWFYRKKKKTENAKDFNSVNNDISFLCLCRLESPSYEVMQLEFEVDNVINLVPTQTLHWNIEYPAGMQTSSRQTEKVSHLYISNADIQGIVPLAEVREDLIDKYRYRYLWGNILAYLAAHIPYAGIDSHFSCRFPPPPPNLLADTPSPIPFLWVDQSCKGHLVYPLLWRQASWSHTHSGFHSHRFQNDRQPQK